MGNLRKRKHPEEWEDQIDSIYRGDNLHNAKAGNPEFVSDEEVSYRSNEDKVVDLIDYHDRLISKCTDILTPREFEVITLIIRGFNEREIIKELCLTYSAYRDIISRLKKKAELIKKTLGMPI